MSSQLPHEELLSAYLDNELGPQERAQIEELLANDSRYSDLLESWTTQRRQLQELPNAKLDDDFASRVMRATGMNVVQPQTIERVRPAGSETNWQSGLIAIASLAALLLVTLFVFPPEITKAPAVAVMETAGADLEALSEPPQPKSDASRERMEKSGMESDAFKPSMDDSMAISGIASDEVARSSSELDRSATLKRQAEGREAFAAGSQPRASKSAPRAFESGSMFDEVDEEAEMVTSKPASQPARPAVSMEKQIVAADGVADPVRGLATKGSESPSLEINTRQIEVMGQNSRRPDNVLVIDLTQQISAKPTTMADVRRVLSNNQIVLQKESPTVSQQLAAQQGGINQAFRGGAGVGGGSVNQAVPPAGNFQSVAKNESATEALFVVSTPTQMKSAILELSRSAQISAIVLPNAQLQNPEFLSRAQQATDSSSGNDQNQSDSQPRENLAFTLPQQMLNESSPLDQNQESNQVRSSELPPESESLAGKAAPANRRLKARDDATKQFNGALEQNDARYDSNIYSFFAQPSQQITDESGQAGYLLIVQQPQSLLKSENSKTAPQTNPVPAKASD